MMTVSNYLVSLKGERAALIREKLAKFQAETAQEFHKVSSDLAAIYRIGETTPDMEVLEQHKAELQERLQCIWFRQSLVQEPTCKFCGSTWVSNVEVDLRYGVDYKQAARKGCFWCCGWCYAHVLNAAYSNVPLEKLQSKGYMRP